MIGVWLVHGNLVEGWSSTIVVISFLCGMNMMITGIIGLYIGRIHAEVKRRPLYVVEKRTGFDSQIVSVAENDDRKRMRL